MKVPYNNLDMQMQKSFLIVFILIVTNTANLAAKSSPWDIADKIVAELNPVTFPDKTYNIADFGAVADGRMTCKGAFDKAITQCSDQGGGRIIVPAGTYYMNGPLVFKSNVNIHLEDGAILNFSSNQEDYLPAVITRWEGTELFNYSPLIYAYHVQNIALTGKGTINGNGSKKFSAWADNQNIDKEILRRMGRENLPIYRRIFGEGFRLRPGFIEPYGCANVRIEGITIKDSPFWVIHPIFCNNVIVRDVTVDSHNRNNDGCDPESCSNVLIEGCTFSTGDDAIAIKSGRDNDAWRIGQPTENVVIRNCTFWSKINGVCIGSEISGGVRNVFIENISILKSSNAIYFKSNLDRGGYIENIYVRNIQADSVRTALVRVEPNYKGERSGFHPTLFNKITVENVTCGQTNECAISMAGFPELPIRNITLKNITVDKAVSDYRLENGENIIFENVRVNGEKLPEKPEAKKIKKLRVL